MKILATTIILTLWMLCSSCTQSPPKSTFLAETEIQLPSDSEVIEDESDFTFMGDGSRTVLFTSTKETKEEIKKEANRLGYTIGKATNRLMVLPEEMKERSKTEDMEEFYITKGAKTVYVVLSNSHIYMWIAWI